MVTKKYHDRTVSQSQSFEFVDNFPNLLIDIGDTGHVSVRQPSCLSRTRWFVDIAVSTLFPTIGGSKFIHTGRHFFGSVVSGQIDISYRIVQVPVGLGCGKGKVWFIKANPEKKRFRIIFILIFELSQLGLGQSRNHPRGIIGIADRGYSITEEFSLVRGREGAGFIIF